MPSKHYLLLPVFGLGSAQGQRRLDELQRLSEIMTQMASELRAEGFEKVTFEMVLKRTEERLPEVFAQIAPEAYTFTGRRVIPNESAFFDWYQSTAEGIEYRAAAQRFAPGMFGHFAKVTK